MEQSGFIEQITGDLFQTGVGDESDRVGDAFFLAVVVDGGHREAGIRPHLYCHPGPSLPKTPHYALQEGHTGVGGVGVAGPQKRRDQVPALAVEDEQRMIHVLPIVAVVVGTFLLSMGGVVGRVEVQKHALRGALLPSLCEVKLEEDFGYLVARAYARGVLEAADGGLAGQIGTALMQRAAHHLEQRVFAKGVRIVLILVAAGYLEDALLDEGSERVASLPPTPLRHTS